MGSPKLTGFLISITMFTFFIGIFGLYLSDMNDKYTVEYDNASLAIFDQLDTMHNAAEGYKDNIEDIGSNKNFLEKGVDIIGGFFSMAKDTVITIAGSFTVFTQMLSHSANELNEAGLGTVSGYLYKMIATVVIILLFIGVILGKVILKKSDL